RLWRRARASVGPARRRQEVFDRAAVVAEHAALADAKASALEDDDAPQLERLGRLLDGLPPAGHAEIGVTRGELLDQPIDAPLQIAAADRRPHRGREHRRWQNLVLTADSCAHEAREPDQITARLRVDDRNRRAEGDE